MAFCREVHNYVRPEVLYEGTNARCIGDVCPDEAIARITCDWRKQIEIARVGELVHHEHFMRRFLDEVAHHRGSDESGATSDKKTFMKPVRSH